MSIDDLIARLEAATEGSAALDRAIRNTLCLPAMLVPPDGGDEAFPYTTSIDAALTLLPEGWSWRTGNLRSGGGFADLGTQQSLQCIVGATPALALCIAALKSRAGCGR